MLSGLDGCGLSAKRFIILALFGLHVCLSELSYHHRHGPIVIIIFFFVVFLIIDITMVDIVLV